MAVLNPAARAAEKMFGCALQPAASLLPSKVNMSSSGRDGTARVTILPVVSAGIDMSVSPAGG